MSRIVTHRKCDNCGMNIMDIGVMGTYPKIFIMIGNVKGVDV